MRMSFCRDWFLGWHGILELQSAILAFHAENTEEARESRSVPFQV